MRDLLESMAINGTVTDKMMLELKRRVMAVINNPTDKKIDEALSNYAKDLKDWWLKRGLPIPQSYDKRKKAKAK